MDIKQKRQDIGLSRIKMAEAMGVHYDTLSKWERQEQKPPAAAVRLARLIGWLVAHGDLARALEDIAEGEQESKKSHRDPT